MTSILEKWKKLKPLKKKRYLRGLIQLIFFIAAAGLYAAAFSGVRSVASSLSSGQLVELTPFLKLALVLLAFTIVFGRFFCGYACGFGTLGDAVYAISSWVQKKMGRKVFRMPEKVMHVLQYVKYLLLFGILALCFFGYYEKVSGGDPWELFAALISGSFHWKQAYVPAAAVLGLIVVGMATTERFFCQFLCPMGAVFALMPTLPWAVPLKRRETCLKGCSACHKNCPLSLSLEEVTGECIQCGKCYEICPKKNMSAGFPFRGKIRGNEWYLIVIKAAILFGVCYPWM